MTLLTLRECDRRLGLRPGTLANEFYFGRLSDDLAAFIGGKRAIPESNVERIAAALRAAGRFVAAIESARRSAQHVHEVLVQATVNGRKLASLASSAALAGK